MDDRKATYERFRSEISGLPAAPDASNRQLLWMSESLLAVARNEASCVELFIVSEHPLRASISVVEDLLAHQVWTSSQGDLSAARIVLPRGEHFDQLAALLCVELIDSGLDEDRQEAFAAVEPLLALALSRDMVGDPVLNGLIGELALLRRLLNQVPPPSRPDVLAAWAGSNPSSRDFQLGIGWRGGEDDPVDGIDAPRVRLSPGRAWSVQRWSPRNGSLPPESRYRVVGGRCRWNIASGAGRLSPRRDAGARGARGPSCSYQAVRR